jgi:hypothetical protein
MPCGRIRPRWDAEQRILWFAGQVMARFHVPAENQERVLNAFEEEDWRPRIDDPLPPRTDVSAKRRLHDTILRLNRHQVRRLLRFRGDGTGEGVCWEAR